MCNLRYIAALMAMSNLDQDILQLLRKNAVTPDEVAKNLGVAWATANGHLLKLVGEGKVVLMRKGRVNVYQAKELSSQAPPTPSWVKPRPLDELSEELVAYFPKNLTAAEMIEKERRRA